MLELSHPLSPSPPHFLDRCRSVVSEDTKPRRAFVSSSMQGGRRERERESKKKEKTIRGDKLCKVHRYNSTPTSPCARPPTASRERSLHLIFLLKLANTLALRATPGASRFLRGDRVVSSPRSRLFRIRPCLKAEGSNE